MSQALPIAGDEQLMAFGLLSEAAADASWAAAELRLLSLPRAVGAAAAGRLLHVPLRELGAVVFVAFLTLRF